VCNCLPVQTPNGFVFLSRPCEDEFCVTSLPTTLVELKPLVTETISKVGRTCLAKVWWQIEYRFDISLSQSLCPHRTLQTLSEDLQVVFEEGFNFGTVYVGLHKTD
jgi:hypothetical protein